MVGPKNIGNYRLADKKLGQSPQNWALTAEIKIFAKMSKIAIYDVLAEILISAVWAKFGGDQPQGFFLLPNKYLYFRALPRFTLKP